MASDTPDIPDFNTTLDNASVDTTGGDIVPNPPTTAPSDPLGSLYDILLPVGQSLVRNTVDTQLAIQTAKAQQKINEYHQNDPSVGPNNPTAAAQVAAQTPAQRWLPSFMLTSQTTTTAGGSTSQKISVVGWFVLAVVVGGILWLILRRRR